MNKKHYWPFVTWWLSSYQKTSCSISILFYINTISSYAFWIRWAYDLKWTNIREKTIFDKKYHFGPLLVYYKKFIN